MDTPFISANLAPPLITKATLLLAEFSLVNISGLPGDQTPNHFSQHPNVITNVLKKITTRNPWAHGGINV